MTNNEIINNSAMLNNIINKEKGISKELLINKIIHTNSDLFINVILEYYNESSSKTKIDIIKYLNKISNNLSINYLKYLDLIEVEKEPKKEIQNILNLKNQNKKIILLISALYEERDALKNLIENSGEYFLKTDNSGLTTFFKKNRDDIKFIIIAIGDKGNNLSKQILTKITNDYNINYVILFGIAAGISSRIKIKDVIITNKIWDLRICKIDKNYEFEPKSIFPPFITTIPFNIENLEKRINKLSPRSKIYVDLIIGTSDNLLRNIEYMIAASKTHRKLGGLEMESGGIAEVCISRNIPFMIVKTIADYGDPNKKDLYHYICNKISSEVVFYGFIASF